MKILFASDIHGSRTACEAVLARFDAEQAERLILLGDLLYHGPRNDLPDAYEPKAVLKLLNEFRVRPFCVRGNCDAEVDQMVLNFPIQADYLLLPMKNGRMAFVTHGHLFNLDAMPPYRQGDLLIHGHTHVHCVVEKEGLTYLNPGSAALPKENQPKSYMMLDTDTETFDIKDLNGKVLASFTPAER